MFVNYMSVLTNSPNQVRQAKHTSLANIRSSPDDIDDILAARRPEVDPQNNTTIKNFLQN